MRSNRRHRHLAWTAALGLSLLGAACSGPAPTHADAGPDAGDSGERTQCLPGAEYPCDCDGGPTGATVCQADGGYGACQCPLPPETADAGDAGPLNDGGGPSDGGRGDAG